MTIHRFSLGRRIFWQGYPYVIKRVLIPEQRVNLEHLETGALLLVDLSELTSAFFSGALWFVPSASATVPVPPAALDLASFPEDVVQVARWRWQVIQPLLALSPEQLTEAMVIDRVRAVQASMLETTTKLSQKVSRASVYRWLKAYRGSGGDLRILLPELAARGGQGKSRLKPAVDALVQSVLQENCFRAEPIGIDDLHALVAARLEAENRLRPKDQPLILPSRSTIVRRVATLDLEDRLIAQRGRRTTQRQFRQAEQMQYPQLPYERVEIDHTHCDVIVIDAQDNLPLGRPTLTFCLDLATRYPLGFYLGFEPPSYFTVMECLYHAICPKDHAREQYGLEHDWLAHGIPDTLVVDNGKEFIGQDLSDACALLGIVLQQCPVMTPELKAGIERHLGSLNSGIFHTLPGTTFSNVFSRGEYDSVHQACISLAELEKALAIFLVDIYAERRHRGLAGVPARRWERAVNGPFLPRLPASRDELAILLGRVEWRVLHPYGIEFECLRYNAAHLGELRVRLDGEKVKLKYHPGDLSRIYVFDPFEKRYHELPALDQDYTQGLSFWKHRMIRRLAAQEAQTVDLAALGRARQKIQDMVDQARSRKRTGTRSKVARWDGQTVRSGEPKKTPGVSGTPVPKSLDAGETSLPDATLYEYDYNLPPNRRDE